MITTSATSLRLVRLARGMRLIDAAQMVGLREKRLSRMETGDVPIKAADLEALARVYGVPVEIVQGTQPLVLRTRAPMIRD